MTTIKVTDVTINKKLGRQQYYNEYVEKNKEKLKKGYVCELCGGKYKYISKSHHVKTKKHKTAVELQNLRKDNMNMKKIVEEMNINISEQ